MKLNKINNQSKNRIISEEIFVIKEVKSSVTWTYVINDLNDENITRTFYEKEIQKTNQQGFRIEKEKEKWKGYDNSLIKLD